MTRATSSPDRDIRVLLAISLLVGIGCAADTPLMPSTTTMPSEPVAEVVTITSAGVSPSSVTVSQGDRVLFVNNDTVAHEMSSDRHPTHESWPAMNQVGFLLPGEARETGNLNDVEVITYHDHLEAHNPALQGSLVVEPRN